MHVFEMVLGIVIVTAIAKIISNFMQYKTTNNESMSGMDERLQKLEDLEERIKTLETIITDQNYDLDQKIKSL
ncbi:MAG: hypothetical protein GY829_03470 [Gammaproteobacteria bacterium]|nr:hypothetical protein [Gammaproteobacteria bacterium]